MPAHILEDHTSANKLNNLNPVSRESVQQSVTNSYVEESPMSTQMNAAPETTAPVVEQPNVERDLVQVFKLLADETRLRIILYLMKEQELNVTALCERLSQSQPAVSHHLALLRVSGLIQPRRDGKHNFYSVRKDRFHEIMGALFKTMSQEGGAEIRFPE